MVFAISIPTIAASNKPDEIIVGGTSVSAYVEQLNSNQNRLWITVVNAEVSITEWSRS